MKPYYSPRSGSPDDLPADLRTLMDAANAIVDRMEAHYANVDPRGHADRAAYAEWTADIYQMVADLQRADQAIQKHPQGFTIKSATRTIGSRKTRSPGVGRVYTPEAERPL